MEGVAAPDIQDLADVRAWLAAARRLAPQLADALAAQVEGRVCGRARRGPRAGPAEPAQLAAGALLPACLTVAQTPQVRGACGQRGADRALLGLAVLDSEAHAPAHMPALCGHAHRGRWCWTAVLRGGTRAQLARLLAASWGEAEVTAQRWAEMRALERARLERAGIHVTAVVAG